MFLSILFQPFLLRSKKLHRNENIHFLACFFTPQKIKTHPSCPSRFVAMVDYPADQQLFREGRTVSYFQLIKKQGRKRRFFLLSLSPSFDSQTTKKDRDAAVSFRRRLSHLQLQLQQEQQQEHSKMGGLLPSFHRRFSFSLLNVHRSGGKPAM